MHALPNYCKRTHTCRTSIWTPTPLVVPEACGAAVRLPSSPNLLPPLHWDLSRLQAQLLEALHLLGQLHEPPAWMRYRTKISRDYSIVCYQTRIVSFPGCSIVISPSGKHVRGHVTWSVDGQPALSFESCGRNRADSLRASKQPRASRGAGRVYKTPVFALYIHAIGPGEDPAAFFNDSQPRPIHFANILVPASMPLL